VHQLRSVNEAVKTGVKKVCLDQKPKKKTAVESFEKSSVNGLDSKASSKTNKTKQKKS